jgi:hypothetical protein
MARGARPPHCPKGRRPLPNFEARIDLWRPACRLRRAAFGRPRFSVIEREFAPMMDSSARVLSELWLLSERPVRGARHSGCFRLRVANERRRVEPMLGDAWLRRSFLSDGHCKAEAKSAERHAWRARRRARPGEATSYPMERERDQGCAPGPPRGRSGEVAGPGGEPANGLKSPSGEISIQSISHFVAQLTGQGARGVKKCPKRSGQGVRERSERARRRLGTVS